LSTKSNVKLLFVIVDDKLNHYKSLKDKANNHSQSKGIKNLTCQ
jgi:hypothetical protein